MPDHDSPQSGWRGYAPVTQREFDLLVDQLKDEHRENTDSLKEINETLKENSNKFSNSVDKLDDRVTKVETQLVTVQFQMPFIWKILFILIALATGVNLLHNVMTGI
jgi:hypothetical protein